MDMANLLDDAVKSGRPPGELKERVNSLTNSELEVLAAAHQFVEKVAMMIALSPQAMAAAAAHTVAKTRAPKWPPS